jgi:hypothetical protein
MKSVWFILEPDGSFIVDHGMLLCYDDKTRAVEIINDWNSIRGRDYRLVEYVPREK